MCNKTWNLSSDRKVKEICLLPVEALRARGDAEDAAAAAGRYVAVDENVERKV